MLYTVCRDEGEVDDPKQAMAMQVFIPPHQELSIRACEFHAHPIQVLNTGQPPIYITVEQPGGMFECRLIPSTMGADLSAVSDKAGGTRAIRLWVAGAEASSAQVTRMPVDEDFV